MTADGRHGVLAMCPVEGSVEVRASSILRRYDFHTLREEKLRSGRQGTPDFLRQVLNSGARSGIMNGRSSTDQIENIGLGKQERTL